MQSAPAYLGIVKSRGKRRLELRRVYRNLQNQELFLLAYAKLYANKGALTPGADPEDTVDGMSLRRIDRILNRLRTGTYKWKPVRRTYISKRNGRQRPLGLPSWTDKLVQEALRMVLEAYYEPQFSDRSHGFRPGRGCHTALQSILDHWHGASWFIEADIRGCFENISHDKLLEIMGRSIKDDRLLKLLRGMLDAGYREDWKYHQTYSGTPQGGVISPLLSNIFLNELDKYVEQELIPRYTRGQERRRNPEYTRLTSRMRKAKAAGDKERYRELRRTRDRIPSGDPQDPNYRRLRYVRYADDFLFGFIGPKAEAREIKRKVGEFLRTLGLTMSEEKTLITHATEGRARFLGYEVYAGRDDSQRETHVTCYGTRVTRRRISGVPQLSVPRDVISERVRRYTKKGKPHHRAELLRESDYDIVMTYSAGLQGLVNYYLLAHNVARLYRLKYIYERSLVRTLAAKHKRKTTWVYGRYRQTVNGLKALVVKVLRKGKKPLVAMFGHQPIRRDKRAKPVDVADHRWPQRSELIGRLTADECELCGRKTTDLQGHHIRKLKDLQKRYAGRANPPRWVIRMIELRRKTLMVCTQCHQDIHAGTYDGPRLR